MKMVANIIRPTTSLSLLSRVGKKSAEGVCEVGKFYGDAMRRCVGQERWLNQQIIFSRRRPGLRKMTVGLFKFLANKMGLFRVAKFSRRVMKL